MWSFSESDWYTTEVSSLEVEHQDLLVGIGHGIATVPRPERWNNEGRDGANYVYVYQEVRLNSLLTKLAYLRHLNWLVAQVNEKGWQLQWVAAEITGTPSQVCLLWRVDREELVEEVMHTMATNENYAPRYAEMMRGIASFNQQRMYPESTEHIDNEMKSRHPLPARAGT